MKAKMKKRRIKGTGRAKMRAIHHFRPRSSSFVQKTIQKEVCIVINPNIRQTIFQPKA
jgi:hypothetical protein